jgi:beta-galactosidase
MRFRQLLSFAALVLPVVAAGAPVTVAQPTVPPVTVVPLTIDLTAPIPAPHSAPYGPGTATDPDGNTITADSQSFFLNGEPWIPVAGEFHYSRYPRDEWRDELLKMKAGGITVVSTYVFWIHQEQNRGTFDWSGQRSLRDFILLCKELDLKVVVRMGPWCHGEVRNGGFPDWVQNSGTKLRSTDPAFLKLVEPLYTEEAKQMRGLLWKDGGPIIGVQLDNECNDAAYLAALKQMAIAQGVDVPYYAITGWQITVPASGFLPLFGGYADGFWGGTPENYRREFMFTNIRATNNLGAQMNDQYPSNSAVIAQFPYACAEIGPGMMSSYAKRIKIDPNVVTAMALSKLGCGNNMPGYYMYQGGINPDGEGSAVVEDKGVITTGTPALLPGEEPKEPDLSFNPGDHYKFALESLQETHPNFMPFKDYDFQTALGACGEVRDQFHLLLEQHLFLQDFGPALARMPAFFPDQKPASLTDFQTLRWDVRTDGTSGFLFFNNEQPSIPLPAHENVQFQLKTQGGTLLVPAEPITIPSGSYGIWPFNLECDGVTIRYATAQPLCRIEGENGEIVYFLATLDGIVPRISLDITGRTVTHLTAALQSHGEITPAKPGTDAGVTVVKPGGGTVSFVILTPEESRRLWRATIAGKDRLMISPATVLFDGRDLRLQADNAKDLTLSVFPSISILTSGANLMMGSKGWLFSVFNPAPPRSPAPPVIGVTQLQPAKPPAPILSGTLEAAWDGAAVYKLKIPPEAAGRHVTLSIHYTGDAARLYIGTRLFDDNYSNGDPMAIALWRIPADHWPAIRLKVLPAPAAAGVPPVNPAVSGSSAEQVEVRLAAP